MWFKRSKQREYNRQQRKSIATIERNNRILRKAIHALGLMIERDGLRVIRSRKSYALTYIVLSTFGSQMRKAQDLLLAGKLSEGLELARPLRNSIKEASDALLDAAHEVVHAFDALRESHPKEARVLDLDSKVTRSTLLNAQELVMCEMQFDEIFWAYAEIAKEGEPPPLEV
jgi:hypothetical protein